MAVLLTTLGFTSDLALAPIRDRPEIDTVHLFYGSPPPKEGQEALDESRAAAKALGVKLQEHPVPGAFDYQAVLQAIATTFRKLKGKEVFLNGSAGTRPMVMAATIFAFTHDVPLLYYDKYEMQQGTEISLKPFSQLRHLGESQRNILGILKDGPSDLGNLSEKLGIAASTLSAHVHKLANNGVISLERQGKQRIATISPAVLANGWEVPA